MKRILAACVLLMAGAWASAQVNGQGGVYINGVLQGGGGSSYSYLWSGGISMLAPTTDTAPDPLLLKGANAWPGATTNTTGANTILAGGIGRRIFTVVDYAQGSMAGSTVTVTVNGVATVLTEGSNWTAATSNNATASSLAGSLNDDVSGDPVVASAVGAVVRIEPKSTVYSLTIAKSAADAGMTATSGTDGIVSSKDSITIANAGGNIILDTNGGAGFRVRNAANNAYAASTSLGGTYIWADGLHMISTPIFFQDDTGQVLFGASLDAGFGHSTAGVVKITNGSTGYGGLGFDTNARQWADTVTLSDNVKTAVLDIAIADAEFIGGTLTYTITATDATDHQALTGIVGFSGVRKGAAYSLIIAESASPVLAESAGASTLTDTWAIDAGTNVATISVTADSSLTTPTMTVRYQLSLNSANAVTKK